MRRPWDATFEELVLSAVNEHCDATDLDPDAPLSSYGLTSLANLALGTRLSDHYRIPLHSFDERAFRNARSLWAFVTGHTPVPAAADAGKAVRGLIHRFLDTAQRHPDAPCLIDGDEPISYAQMVRQVAALASALPRRGVVAVLGEREAPTYRGYLAGLFAGATVVPLSMDFPPERNADVVRQAEAQCVVVTDRREDPLMAAHLAAMGDLPVVDGAAPPPAAATVPCDEVSPDAVAYFIFTSGSTGRPKGVGITHRNIDAFLTQALPTFEVGPGDVFSQCHGLTFDFSVFEMWGAWSTGAALRPVSRIQALDPPDTVTRHGVTVWACTPSLIESATAAGRLAPHSMPELRHLVFGGEPLSVRTVELARRAAPNAVIDNVYGPTETTVWATTHRIPPGQPLPAEGIVAIGTPVAGMRVRVDAAGELLLAGPQVFGGYVDPTLDEGKFVQADGHRWYRTGDLVDRDGHGLLHHRGRVDGQVKVRGYRVELGEIEQTASRLLDGTRTAALRVSDTAAGAQLVLFVEAPSVDEGVLRRRLAEVLPGYMMPGRIITVGSFRLTAHAKLDRAHLTGLATGEAAVPG